MSAGMVFLIERTNHNTSVIRENGKSQNGGDKKTKYAKFSEKRTFTTLWYVHVHACIYDI